MGIHHDCQFVCMGHGTTGDDGAGMRPVGDAAGVEGEGGFLDTTTAAETTTDVIENLVGLDIAMGVGNLDRQGMGIEQTRGEGTDHESSGFESLVDRRGLMAGAGDRFEIVRVEGVGINKTIPANHIKRVLRQPVSAEAGPIANQDRHIFFLVDDQGIRWPMKIAFAVRRSEPNLAIGVEIAWRQDNIVTRLDHQEIRIHTRIKFDGVGGGVWDDDVVVLLKRENTKQRQQSSRPFMDKEDLIGTGVAVKFLLGDCRSTATDEDIGIEKQRDPPADGISLPDHVSGLEMMMTQNLLGNRFEIERPGGFDLANPSRWPKVIGNAVGSPKASGCDDFFVIDSLIAIAWMIGQRNVPFGGNQAKLVIGRHEILPEEKKRGRLQCTPPGLFAFDGLEKSLEVPLAETA